MPNQLSHQDNRISRRHAQAAKNVASSTPFRKCGQPVLHLGLSDHQLNQLVFVQPDPGRLLCPIESCGRRYAQAKALYKHCRQKSDALHKKLALAFGGRSCDFCHEDFKRLYDLERHIIKAHKSLPPTVEELNSLKSTPQSIELQLRQRNVDSNPTIPALRPSKGQASLLCSDRCKCGHSANPHQPCWSGNGGPAPWIEASANSGNTKAIQPDGLVSKPYPPIQESVQNECSTNWRNTVMSPQNDPRHSCNHQPFLSKGKGLAYELGPSATSIGTRDFSPAPLLFLLYSLGCSEIREDILFRGLFPQKRWNDHGTCRKLPFVMPALTGRSLVFSLTDSHLRKPSRLASNLVWSCQMCWRMTRWRIHSVISHGIKYLNPLKTRIWACLGWYSRLTFILGIRPLSLRKLNGLVAS